MGINVVPFVLYEKDTLAIPLVSVAVAVRLNVPDTLAPAAGAEKATTGGVVSGGAIRLTDTAAEVAVLAAAALSTALAVIEYAPSASPDVFQLNV
jgi:hypothetical protein